ncbi:type III toxin-antitoxin system ToxN/AbiQ family toxin [Vibrio cholerae]|nr:type III toxin-antitoxin system ToxN/AbiQ family toxin [Vibrio cholerae]
MDLKFFTVDEKYIQYLKQFDAKVPDNYSEEKPFIGILFSINGLDYIAPLSSAKPKHSSIKNSSPTTFKVFDGTVEGDLLAIIQLNNMIPVNAANIVKINTASLDIKYQYLLLKEINFIRTHRDKLLKKASKLYDMVVNKKIECFVNLSCNFKALEAAANSY